MSFKHTLFNYLSLTVILASTLKADTTSCVLTLPFDDTKLIINKDTKTIYTTTGLYFELPNALKLIYAQGTGIGTNMVAHLTKQETLPDGKFKCHYQMTLNPLIFEANFDPNAPLPIIPAANPDTSLQSTLQTPVAPEMMAPTVTPGG